MKILIVSGFLGAGKTTFIKALAKNTNKEFVILENEYGEIGIDGQLFEEEQEEETVINIWELTEGCVCCSTKANFAASVLTIANAIDPEYLVVEPSGVGQLSRIIDNVRKLEYDRIQILAPITIVDIRAYDKYMVQYKELYEDQIQSASTIVLSHSEGCIEDEFDEICLKLEDVNPTADIATTHYSMKAKEWWSTLIQKSLSGEIIVQDTMSLEEMENLGLSGIELEIEFDLLHFLQQMVWGMYGQIVRAKGYLQIGTNWIRFDVMDTNYTVTGIEEQEDSRAIFIGNGIRRNEIRKVLQSYMMEETKMHYHSRQLRN